MRFNKGFTLIELMVALGVTGILAIASSVAYYQVIPRVQAAEALKLMTAERAKVANNITRGYCANAQSGQIGRYGTLVVSGTYVGKQDAKCPTGCRLTYTFKDSDLSAKLKTKKITADFLQGSLLSLVASETTLGTSYIPKALINIESPANCATSADGTGSSWSNVTTGGDGIGGSETGISPSLPGGDGDGGNNNGGGTDPGDGNGGTEPGVEPLPPVDPVTPTPQEEKNIVRDISSLLSRGKKPVLIEPQGFDYTVTAKPTQPGGLICSDTMNVKADEWVIRLGDDAFYNSSYNYNVMNKVFVSEFLAKAQNTFDHKDDGFELAAPSSNNKVARLKRSVRLYVPCSVAVVADTPVGASFVLDSMAFDTNVDLTVENFGMVAGRGGDGLHTSGSWTSVLSTTNNSRYFVGGFVLADQQQNPTIPTGGVAIVNLTTKPLQVNNYGILTAGWDARVISNPTGTSEGSAQGGMYGGALPYGKAGTVSPDKYSDAINQYKVGVGSDAGIKAHGIGGCGYHLSILYIYPSCNLGFPDRITNATVVGEVNVNNGLKSGSKYLNRKLSLLDWGAHFKRVDQLPAGTDVAICFAKGISNLTFMNECTKANGLAMPLDYKIHNRGIFNGVGQPQIPGFYETRVASTNFNGITSIKIPPIEINDINAIPDN